MNKVKMIIFDLDGTLYNLEDVVAMNYQMQLDFYAAYTKKSKAEVTQVFEENNIFPVITEGSKSATEFFVCSGIPIEEWNSYRERFFDISVINTNTAISQNVIEQFADVSLVILLSSNSLMNIKKILDHIGIGYSCFVEIICSDHKYGEGPFKKYNEMKILGERYNVIPQQILSIGDRFKTDIEPMLEIGGKGIVVSGPFDLQRILDSLMSGDWSDITVYGE